MIELLMQVSPDTAYLRPRVNFWHNGVRTYCLEWLWFTVEVSIYPRVDNR